METDPLSVILVKSGSKGDRLLLRYPYMVDSRRESTRKTLRKNPYAVIITEDILTTLPPQTSNISNGQLTGFSDTVLSNLFAVKPDLCGNKFELKVNDVRFVGHPMLLQSASNVRPSPKRHTSTIILINIVFALRAVASKSIVKCYHDLSQRLGIALLHEERRCGYLSQEAKIMITAHDEEGRQESPFDLILERSQLARDLRQVHEDLCSTGVVQLRINKWIEVSFCLPQKVHQMHNQDLVIQPEAINKCLQALRPYHTILLLADIKDVLESLSPDASPALRRLIKVCSPMKSLQCLAADADLTLSHVFQLAGHLLYWAKATIIYPLCGRNVYVLAPGVPAMPSSSLTDKFSEQFPGMSLLQVMSEFSLPVSLSQKANPINSSQQTQLVQMIVWMLQHHILMQLHTYVSLVPTAQGPSQLQDNHIRDSRQSTPDEFSMPRVASDSDFGSVMSDELISSPSNAKTDSMLSDDGVVQKHIQDTLLSELSPVERSEILKVPASNIPEDLRLFARLCPYFRGTHHLEEIMYRENVRRSRLEELLDKFRDVLVTNEHEDIAVAIFYTNCYAKT